MNASEFAQSVESGFPEFAAAVRRDDVDRDLFLRSRSDSEIFAAEEVAHATTRAGVVLVGIATPWAKERRQEMIAAHKAHRCNGNALHIGPGGRPYEPSNAEVHVGVLTHSMPRQVFDLCEDYPLPEIFKALPVEGAPCDMPTSVDIVGGGSYYCTHQASGYAIDFTAPWVIVYRCCIMCARMLFEDRWRRGALAEESAHELTEKRR